MEFIDKITKTANQTYKYTTEKTNKLAKEVKLKSLMNRDKEKISEIYEKIGKLVYESHIRENENEDILEEIQNLCGQIDAYSKEIEFNRIEILKLKDLKQCPNCSFEMGLNYKFCPNCGIKQEENVASNNNSNENIKEEEQNNTEEQKINN